MKRKIILILLALVFVFSCVALVACNKGEKEALDTYLLEQDNQLVDADFTLPVKIREYDVTWTSSDSAITLEKRDSDYLAKVTLGDAVKEVTLTVSIGKLSKSFTVRVAEFDVYFIADHYNFVKDKTTVTEDFALDRSFTYQGKTATIDWSVSDAYADYIAISEDGNTCLVYPTSLLPTVRIKATFTYNNESTTYQYTMAVGLNRTHLEEINYWYYNTGVSIDIKGYVVEIATPYDEGYGNVSLYVVDEEFLAGYYVYRVKTDSANAALIEVGAHVTITGTTNTNYNGLIETNAGGNLVVDTDVPKIDVREHVYALDQDILGNVPAAIYHQSRLVSLTNWTVKSVESAPEAGSTATLFTLTKGGVDVSVAVSKYLEGAYKPTADDATWSALAALTGTVKEGDVVSVTGVLGNYNGAQIMPLKASDVVVGGTADPDGTVYPGQTAAKAIAAVNAALKQNGVDKRITKTTEFTLPTESNGVAIAYEICGSPRALTLDGSKFTVTPDKHEIATVKVTYTLKDGETVVYSTVQFFDVESLVPTASTIMDELVAPPATAEKDFELDANATWEVVEGTGITIENGVAKLTRTAEDQKVTLKATVSYNNETKTKNFVVTVAADPYLAYYRITLDVDSMQLKSNTYQDGSVTIDRVAFEYTELGNYGDGIQMRIDKNDSTGEIEGTSYIANTNAFHAGIKMIVVTLSSTKTVYDNADAFSFKFGTSTDELGHEVKFSTVAGQYVYEIVPDAETYTYFSLTKIIESYSFYFKSIEICFTEPNDITYTDEEKVDAELAALKVDKLTYTENGTATLPVAGTTHTDVTISWASNNAAVVVDGANLAVTMPSASTRAVLTATVTCGNVSKTKTFPVHMVVDVVDAAYNLLEGETIADMTLTGVIIRVDDAYSEQHKNVTVTIIVDGKMDKLIECFRMTGEQAATIKAGDKITVTGDLTNYKGKIEFNSGCVLTAVTTATADELEYVTLFNLEIPQTVTENFTLPEGATYVVKDGTAIAIDGLNATVTRGEEDATVVITATINGKSLDYTVVVKADDGGEPPVPTPGTEEDPYTVAEALAAAGQLEKGEYSEKVYILGTVVSIGRVGSYYSNLYIVDTLGDADQLLVYSANLGSGIDAVYPNDTVLFYGYLTNFNGTLEVSSKEGDYAYMEEVTRRGTSTITVDEASSANAQVVELSAESGTNGTTFTFKVTVDEGYQIVSVKVNGEVVTANAESVYTATISGNTTIVVSTSLIGVTTNTVDAVIADMVADKGWTNGNKVENPFTLDEVISVSYTGGQNTGKYYDSGSNIRIYQGEDPTVTISAADGYVITSVTISYISNKTGTLVYESANIASDQTITLNAASITFNVGNTSSDVTNGQVRITAISVTYQEA